MMTIRAYRQTDADSLINIFRLNTPQFFAPEEEKDLFLYLDKQSLNYFIIELNGEVIGGGGFNLFYEEKIARISWDLIHRELHGKGYGSLLVEFRINKIKKITNISHIVVRTSQHAYKFYERFGFTLKYVEEDYWAKGYHLYFMEYEVIV